MIMFMSPSIVAKANLVGLSELYDINIDGKINMEDVNLIAAKEGVTIPTEEIPIQPQVVKELVVKEAVI